MSNALPTLRQLENADEFVARHIGIEPADEARMLPVIGHATRAELIDGIVPPAIPVSYAAKGTFDVFFTRNLSPDQVEALDELFPATNHWAGGAIRPTANAVS